MSEDRLPGWNVGANFLASQLTGVAAAMAAFALMTLDNTVDFQPSLDLELILALLTIILIGMTVGLIIVLPIAMIFSGIGIRLALGRPWVADRRTWAAAGAVVGAIVLLVPFLISTGADPSHGPIPLFGAACGMTAALLCHWFQGIRQPV